jgi:hypothetical protein
VQLATRLRTLRSRSTELAALGAAALVMLAGVAYVELRSVDYTSQAKVILEPTGRTSPERTTAIGTFLNSGTLGTYVELLSSGPTLEQPKYASVDVKARAIVGASAGGSNGNTRVIKVIATSTDAALLEPALRSLLASVLKRQPQFRDIWELRVLQGPSSPEAAPPTSKAILQGTLVLALLAAVIVWTLFRRDDSTAGARFRPRMANRWRRSAGTS